MYEILDIVNRICFIRSSISFGNKGFNHNDSRAYFRVSDRCIAEKTKPDSPISDSRQSERDTGEDLEEINMHEEMQKTQQADNLSQNGINADNDKDTVKDATYDHISPETKRSPVQHRTSSSISTMYSSNILGTFFIAAISCYFQIERTALLLMNSVWIVL